MKVIKLVKEEQVDKQAIIDVLENFLGQARKDELREVLVIAVTNDALYFGSSGNASVSEQLGFLEQFKYRIIERTRD